MNKISKDRATKLISKGAIVIDLRSPVSFRDGHIEGAKNQTLRQFTNQLMTISDKKTSILVYGDTFSDDDLKHALNYADQLGFSKVQVADYHTIR